MRLVMSSRTASFRQFPQGGHGLLHVGEQGVGGDPLLQGLAGPGHALGGPADSVGLALVGEQRARRPAARLGAQRLGPADQFLFQKFQAQAGFGAQAHHGEGVGCVLCPEHGAAVAGQIALVHHQKGVRLVQGLVQQRRVFFPHLLGPVADQQDQVRLVQGLAAAGHPQLLDGIVAVPQAGGVHQTEEVSL